MGVAAPLSADAECERLVVMAEGIVTSLADLALVPDQDVELEAFNRSFEVRADDRKPMTEIVGPPDRCMKHDVQPVGVASAGRYTIPAQNRRGSQMTELTPDVHREPASSERYLEEPAH